MNEDIQKSVFDLPEQLAGLSNLYFIIVYLFSLGIIPSR